MLFSRLNRLKLRLQFTGWLQYIPTTIVTMIVLLIAAVTALLGGRTVATAFAAIGTALLIVLIFDLVTVKLRLHPTEPLPQGNDGLDAFDLMRARRSCRAFQTRSLTPADYDELMDSVRRHSGEATLGDAPIRFEYISAPLTVWPVVNATEFLVAIVPKEYKRFAVIDVGRSLQKIVVDATRMGLATCWIGPGADHASIVQHMGDRFDPEADGIICLCAVGYRSRYKPLFLRIIQRLQRRRLPLSSLFFADAHFEQPLDVDAPPFNRFGRTYEVCQWSPSSFNGQTTRCVAVMDPELVRFDFYATTESRYYAPVALGIWCANWELGCEAQNIDGHFAVLPTDEEADEEDVTLPRYDVSWVLSAPV